jgi:hypothetical protein
MQAMWDAILSWMNTADWKLIRDWVAALLGPIVTLIGFVFIYKQLAIAALNYKHATKQSDEAQRWKKAEFLAEQVTAFFADRGVDRVVRMLDWGGGRKIVFEEEGDPVLSFHTEAARSSVALRGDESRKLMTDGRYVVLDRALRHHSERPDGFTEHEAHARDAFDWFLLRLGQFQSMIDSRLFTYDEVEVHLEYVLDLVSGGGSTVAPELAGVLDAYIARYDFKPVATLAAARRAKRNLPLATAA